MKKVKANIRFRDTTIGNEWRKQGEVFTVTDERAWQLTQTHYQVNGPTYCSYAELPWSKEGPRILIYNYDLYKIGGTETFLYNLCKYYKDKNIVLMYRTGKPEYINLLHEFVEVCQDDGKSYYGCDVLIMGSYFASEVNPRVNAKQRYQMVHADYRGMKQAGWQVNLIKPKDTKFIAVSQTAADGLRSEFGYNSIVQYNILDKTLNEDKPLVFITLSRATREKGIERIVALCDLFKKCNKKFLWLLCGTVDEQSGQDTKKRIAQIPELLLVPPSHNNKTLIRCADYLVQLSDTESFCYSAYEALIMGKPIILSDFPEAKNAVVEGKNGYIIPRDITKYDEELVEKIFNHIPTEITYEDRCDYDLWERIFSGEEVDYN